MDGAIAVNRSDTTSSRSGDGILRRLALDDVRAFTPADDPEFTAGCLTRTRAGADDDGENERCARTALEAYGVDWDLRLRRKVGLLRGLDPYGMVRQAIYRQAARNVRRHFPEVHAAQMRARQNGGLSGTFQFARLWEIAQIVEQFQVHSCIEFGGGASTAMLARLPTIGERLVTLEESEIWHARLADVLGDVGRRTDTRCVPAIHTTSAGLPVVHYDFEVDREFDMAYVDGPSNSLAATASEAERQAAWQFDPRAGQLPCVDVERMWNRDVFPRVIAIDGRRSTVRRLAEIAGGRYAIHLASGYEAIRRGGVPDRFLHHTLFLRR